MFLKALLLSFLTTSLAGFTTAGASNSTLGNVIFDNNRRFLFDTDGRQIDVYGAKIQSFAGKYYFYGNSFSQTGVALGIKSYSSVDLTNWKYEGYLFDTLAPNPCMEMGGCGRPHIVYNAKTSKYVLWANAGSVGYKVATSSSPSSGFSFLPSAALIQDNCKGLQPADHTVESYGDKAYVVYSCLDFRYPDAGSLWPPISQSLFISELTSDFTNTTLTSYAIKSSANDLTDNEAESSDLFLRNGTFYVTASNTCGYCPGSIGIIYRSKSIQGPWERDVIAADSCNAQHEGVLPLVDPSTGRTTYVWHSTSVPGGPRIGFTGHVFQPLNFNQDGSIQPLDCSPTKSWNVAFEKGTGSIDSGNASISTDQSPPLATYNPVCDSDEFTLYQVWKSSKAGSLKEVTVNIAKSVQSIPLQLSVFRFRSLADLVRPNYKYELLGSATYSTKNISFVFDTVSVDDFKNATVSKNDYLGFSITGPDYAPYCHMEYDMSKSQSSGEGTPLKPVQGMALFQQKTGQNSWLGLDRSISPIQQREGKGVKFFATVV